MTTSRKLFEPLLSITGLLQCLLPFGSAQPRVRRPARRGFARVHGARLYYEMQGNGHPLVLIHGGQMDRRMWDPQFDLFARRYTVLRYDVRGYGRSDMPAKGFSHAEDLSGLLDFLRLEKASLIGLSLGGRIAIDFALSHPERVETLVLAGPGLGGYRFTGQSGWSIVEAARDEGLEKAAEMWLENSYMAPAMQNPAIRDRMRQLALENAHTWLANPIFERHLKPPAIERLSDIHVPTLIVVGDRDVEDIQKIVEILRGGIAGSEKQVIPGAGHIVNMEKPEEFNQVVLGFLEKRNLV
jgi:pimeloyl-ACP methyl ester carboxylesterase